MKKYEKPFEFPSQLLHQVAECSKDGCFFLIYKDDNGGLVPVMHALNQSDALALSSFTQKYLAAMDNVEIQQLVEMFHETINEHLIEGDEGLDGEEE